MAEDAEKDVNDQARRRPKAPKPKRESALIEGQAIEIREPSVPDEGARAPEPAALSDIAPTPAAEAPRGAEAALASPAPAVETEASSAPEPARAAPAFGEEAVRASEAAFGVEEPHAPGAAFAAPDAPPPPAEAALESAPALEPAAAAEPFPPEPTLAESPPAEAPPPPPPVREPPAAAPPPPAPSRSGALGLGLAAGIVGAGIALAAAWMVDPRAGALDGVEARLHELEAADQRDAQADKSLEARVAALESAKPAAGASPDLAGLEKRIAAIEASEVKPDALRAAANEAREAKEAAAKALALASGAAASGASAPSPAPDPGVAALRAAQQGLEARVGKNEAALDDRLAKADAASAKAVADLGDRVAKSDAALGRAIDGLKERLAKLEGVVFAPKIETRVPPAETADDAEKKALASSRAIASLALSERFRAGSPYAVEWDALSRAGADASALAALKPFAQNGAPTLAALERSFHAIEPAVLAAGKPPSADGAVGRIMDQMSQLVRVRRVSETPGETPDAVVSQIDGALSRGDLAAALAAYRRLPDASRAVAADWAKSAQDRADAEAASRSLRDASIAGLDAKKS